MKTAGTGKFSHSPQAGYTLVEGLVATLILALMTGILMQQIGLLRLDERRASAQAADMVEVLNAARLAPFPDVVGED